MEMRFFFIFLVFSYSDLQQKEYALGFLQCTILQVFLVRISYKSFYFNPQGWRLFGFGFGLDQTLAHLERDSYWFRIERVMSCVYSMQPVEDAQQEVGAFSPKTFPDHEKKNPGFRRTIAWGEYLFFVVVDLLGSVRWKFCSKSMRWPNSDFKIFESNAVFIKRMLESSIIVHRALSLRCKLVQGFYVCLCSR